MTSPTQLNLGRTKYLILLICCLINMMPLGFVSGLGVLYVSILDSFQSSRAEAASIQSACVGLLFGGGILSGLVVDRIGPGLTIMLGSVLATVGCLVSAFAPSVHVLVATAGCICGTGFSLIFLAATSVVGQLSASLPRLSVTLVNVSLSIGCSLVPIFNSVMLEIYGWRGTYILLTGLIMNCFVGGAAIYVLTHRTLKSISRTRSMRGNSEREKTWREFFHVEVFRNPRYVLFSLLLVPIHLTIYSPPIFIVDIAVNLGLDLQAGTVVLTLIGFMDIVGRLLGGVLRRICGFNAILQYAVSTFLCDGCVAAFILPKTFVPLLMTSISYGLLFGLHCVMIPITVLELVDIHSYATAVGYTYGMAGLGDIMCGPVGGAIKDRTGRYDVMFAVGGVTGAVAGLALVIIYCWGQRVTDRREVIVVMKEEDILFEEPTTALM